MSSYEWTRSFKAIYGRALDEYSRGNRNAGTYFKREEAAFLASIGCTAGEVYDFAEDHPAIELETALLITDVRRSYFLLGGGRGQRGLPGASG